jgi:diguanylate cyclase (GGDEF)-like protein
MTRASRASRPAAAPGPRPGRPLPASHRPTPHGSRRLITHNDILELIVQNASLANILQVVTAMVEREIAGSRASILLLDNDCARVHVGAGPSLPAEFNAAIEGAAIGPTVGTCGIAAYEKRVVITPSIADDPAWQGWRPVAESAGLVACWSTPFLGLHDRVLGTFAVYFDEPRRPRPSELALLHDAGYLTAVAVQHDTVRRLLRDTSRTNPLTGLPNRIALTERLAAVEARSIESRTRFAVIQVAIDGISPINESLGPTVGDAVLRTTAERLTALVDGAGMAAHVWGSDFVVLLGDLQGDANAHTVAEQVGATLTEPLEVEGMTLEVGVHIGLATYDGEIANEPRPLDEPLRTASVALERAKAAGTHQIGIYDPRSDPGADVSLLAPALRRGIDREELTVAYQPVVELTDERVDHYEALLRWTSPHGAVSPESFVPVAEQTGMVNDLGRYALERALAELSHQRASGRDTGISVNLSVRQLSDDGLPDLIAALIAENALPPDRVTMEVTEGVLLTASGKGWEKLGRIKEVGVRVSLDDFGTGFSQISYLRRFRFDEIKLDRTFIRDMDEDTTAYAIIAGAIRFAEAAGLDVVAEGIERRDQADRLRELGCTHGQGYLFGAARSTASAE